MNCKEVSRKACGFEGHTGGPAGWTDKVASAEWAPEGAAPGLTAVEWAELLQGSGSQQHSRPPGGSLPAWAELTPWMDSQPGTLPGAMHRALALGPHPLLPELPSASTLESPCPGGP